MRTFQRVVPQTYLRVMSYLSAISILSCHFKRNYRGFLLFSVMFRQMFRFMAVSNRAEEQNQRWREGHRAPDHISPCHLHITQSVPTYSFGSSQANQLDTTKLNHHSVWKKLLVKTFPYKEENSPHSANLPIPTW